MVYNFKINIIIRLGILLLLILGIALSLENGFHLTTGFGVLLCGILIVNLFNYVDQTNKDLANFFESIQYNDFNTTGSGRHRGDSFGNLHDGFNLINRKFRDIRAEKEANHQFLQTVVEHVEVGLLCIDEEGEVVLMNKALQRLIRKSYLVNLKGLKKIDEHLWEAITQLKPGDRELLKLNIDNRLMQIAVRAIDLILNKENLRLISFQNIQSELEAQELVAYQKLIRILTHEIMNSVAPIASLSSTVNDVIADKDQLAPDYIQMIKNAVRVIKKRSEGLLDFTETYRSLTRIPPPNFQIVSGEALLEELQTLFKPDLDSKKITLNLHLPPSPVTFQGDPNLLEQVLINLLKNAADSLVDRDHPTIDLYLQKTPDDKVIFRVVDNGNGIPQDMMDQIFVPFFTTKDEGSGIGLSLSRQIIRLHKGELELQSVEGEGTVVTIVL
ncbi:MAG: HAMP domain-containing sensor histidine kinase [Saprospiraceae bacterium]